MLLVAMLVEPEHRGNCPDPARVVELHWRGLPGSNCIGNFFSAPSLRNCLMWAVSADSIARRNECQKEGEVLSK